MKYRYKQTEIFKVKGNILGLKFAEHFNAITDFSVFAISTKSIQRESDNLF